MLRDIVLCALGLAMPLQSGCSPSVRFGAVSVSPEQGAYPEVIADVEAASFPVAYVWRGGAQIIGSTIHPEVETDRVLLKGRLRAQTFTAFSPSRVIRVEAVDDAHRLLWFATGKLKRDRGTVRRRSRTGTFSVELPALRNVDHLHAGVIAQRDAADMLPGTCLQNNS